MATTAVAPAGGLVSGLKALPARLGALAGKVGDKLGPLVGRVADSRVVRWSGEQVRNVVVPDQVIRGWQDVYKGVKTLEPASKTIRTVRIVRNPAALEALKSTGRSAGKVAKGAAGAGKVVKATKAAGAAKGVASGAARKGDLVLREVTKINVTRVELVGKGAKASREAGLRVVRGAKFRLGGSGAQTVGKGAKAIKGASGPGGSASAVNGAKAIKGARVVKGAKAIKGAKVVKGAKAIKGAKAGKGAIVETQTTVTRAAAKGFKKPFGVAALREGLGNIFRGAMKAAKVGAVVNLVLAVVTNGYGVLSGQIGLPEAMGEIVRETATGFVAGGFAAVFSGGVLAIAGALGVTAGLPVFLIGLGASLLGWVIASALFNATIGDGLKNFVQRLFGG